MICRDTAGLSMPKSAWLCLLLISAIFLQANCENSLREARGELEEAIEQVENVQKDFQVKTENLEKKVRELREGGSQIQTDDNEGSDEADGAVTKRSEGDDEEDTQKTRKSKPESGSAEEVRTNLGCTQRYGCFKLCVTVMLSLAKIIRKIGTCGALVMAHFLVRHKPCRTSGHESFHNCLNYSSTHDPALPFLS